MQIEPADVKLAEIRDLQAAVQRFEAGLPREGETAGVIADAPQIGALTDLLERLRGFVSAWERPRKRNFADVTPAVVERTVWEVLGTVTGLVKRISRRVGVNDGIDPAGARLGRELVALLASFCASPFLGGGSTEVYVALKLLVDEIFSPSNAVVEAVRDAGSSARQSLPETTRGEFDRYYERAMRNSLRKHSS